MSATPTGQVAAVSQRLVGLGRLGMVTTYPLRMFDNVFKYFVSTLASCSAPSFSS